MRSLFAALAASALTFGAAAGAWAAQPLVTPQELDALRTQPAVHVIDIRSADAYAAAHVPGAVSAPYARWRGPAENPGKLPAVETLTELVRSLGLDRDAHAVVVSSGADSTDFGASARVYWTLKYLGLTELSVLNGGQKAWVAADLPQDQVVPRVTPTRFEAQLNEHIIANTAQVAGQVGEPGTRLVDARPLDFYMGKTKAPSAAVPGTIRGAINVDNARWFEPGTAIFVTPARAREIAADLLPSEPAAQTISFCNTGHWAATDWFALSEVLGQENVRLYPESMAAWSQDASLPMDHVPSRGAQLLNRLKGALGLVAAR